MYVADTKDGRVEAFTNAGLPDGGWDRLTDLSRRRRRPDGTIVVADAAGIHRFAIDGTKIETLSTWPPRPVSLSAPTGRCTPPIPPATRCRARRRHRHQGLDEPMGSPSATDGTIYVSDPGDAQCTLFDQDGRQSPGPPATADSGRRRPRRPAVRHRRHRQPGAAPAHRRLVDRDLRRRQRALTASRRTAAAAPTSSTTSALRLRRTARPATRRRARRCRRSRRPRRNSSREPEPQLGVRARASAVSGTVQVGRPASCASSATVS